MAKVSIFVLADGKWSHANTYEGFRTCGVIVEENSAFENLLQTIIDDLSLDPLRSWNIFFKSNSNNIPLLYQYKLFSYTGI